MKPITMFRPKAFLQRDVWITLSFAGKLVLQEGWDRIEAVLMACDYYQIENTEEISNLLDRFINEGAYNVVQVPNKLNGAQITRYIKDKFG